MRSFLKYFSYLVIALYFFLGVFVLVSPMFSYMSKEIRYIFAIFLFLYGGFRIARIMYKRRRDQEDSD